MRNQPLVTYSIDISPSYNRNTQKVDGGKMTLSMADSNIRNEIFNCFNTNQISVDKVRGSDCKLSMYFTEDDIVDMKTVADKLNDSQQKIDLIKVLQVISAEVDRLKQNATHQPIPYNL